MPFGDWAISKQLFDYLRETLPSGSTILELGSGAGTAELAKHYRMYSVEHDASFLNQHSSTYIHAPIVNGWYDTSIFSGQRPSSYDLLLVDGPPQTIGREGILQNLALLDLTKPAVIDDVHREPERRILDALARHIGVVPEIRSDGTKSFGILRPSQHARTVSPLALAMTTAPRRQATLDRSLSSLRAAGFGEDVHVFAEPGTLSDSGSSALATLDGRMILHENAYGRGCFGNWKGALEWLILQTTASWMLLLQDDAIWQPDSAKELFAQMAVRQDQRTGLISPYTSPVVVANNFVDGWNECHAGWGFWGALALCMKRVAAEELIQHPRFANHAGDKQVDAVVAASMLDLNRPSFVHVPSLVDHIGATSTIGRDGDSEEGRRGYRFRKD